MKLQEFIILFFLFGVTPLFAKTGTDWGYYQMSGNRSEKWDPLVEAGFTALDGGNTNAGVHFLKRGVNLGCRDGLVYFRLAAVREADDDLKGALEILLMAETLLEKNYPAHPASLEIKDHLGNLYYGLGKFAEAKGAFLSAIEKRGENFVRLFLVGQIDRMNGEMASALSYFEKALLHSPPPEASDMKIALHLELLEIYHAAENDEKVLEQASAILESVPNHPKALQYKEEVLRKRSQSGQDKSWKKILEQYQ